MQGTRVRSLIREDSTCLGATKPSWAHPGAAASEAHEPGACAPQQGSTAETATGEEPKQQGSPSTAKNKEIRRWREGSTTTLHSAPCRCLSQHMLPRAPSVPRILQDSRATPRQYCPFHSSTRPVLLKSCCMSSFLFDFLSVANQLEKWNQTKTKTRKIQPLMIYY